jgi:hypothetical protein
MTETIWITNPGNHPADFEWERDHSMICIATGVMIGSRTIRDGEPIDTSLL